MPCPIVPCTPKPTQLPTPTRQTLTLPLTRLSGWGRYPVVEGHEALSEDLERITAARRSRAGSGARTATRHCRRRGSNRVAGSVLADRVLAFDPDTGIVRAEAGCPLWRLNRIFLPRGFFTPVTPGTHYVTLGGMVAADVHGKSHHVDGCFGEHVTRLKMRVADGRILECSDDDATRPVPRHARRHGLDRAHPRGRVSPAPHPDAMDLAGERADARLRRDHSSGCARAAASGR